jgi:hypothetical protein
MALTVLEIQPWSPDLLVTKNSPGYRGQCTWAYRCPNRAAYAIKVREATGRVRRRTACEYHRGLAAGLYPWQR